jgi:hypothetical protein
MQQDRHDREKRALKKENKELKNDNRVHKVSVSFIHTA